jgi:hypothetical protein
LVSRLELLFAINRSAMKTVALREPAETRGESVRPNVMAKAEKRQRLDGVVNSKILAGIP